MHSSTTSIDLAFIEKISDWFQMSASIPRGGGGGGSIYRSHQKYQEFQVLPKIFEILTTKKKIPPFCTLTLRKDPKMHRNTPK